MPLLVLLGGGHSHIEVLRLAATRPFPADITLVEPHAVLPYTGMVPAFIAGRYAYDDILIPLDGLCERARVRVVRARAAAIDPDSRELRCDDGRRIAYDVLSIDTGSVLDLSLPGAAQHVLPARPLLPFVQTCTDRIARGGDIVIVGAGAAGIELALAVDARARASRTAAHVSVVGDSQGVATGLARGARRRLEQACRTRGVTLHLGHRVARVTAGSVDLENGKTIVARTVIWATGPTAPGWLRDTGCALDDKGYLAVDDALRVGGRANVFAAGDVASMVGHPRPKAGVYAVKGAPVLAENLRRALKGEAPVPYRPQRHALALIGTGDGSAVAAYGPFAAGGRLMWRWKDAIDRRFVARYRAAAR